MKKIISIFWLTILSLIPSLGLGIRPANADLPNTLTIQKVDETTPLYLEMPNLNSMQEHNNLLAWHYSHYSHESHYSHYSHSSHESHYSHYSGY
jgi:hypothetical protein